MRTVNDLLRRARGRPEMGLHFVDASEEMRFASWEELGTWASAVACGVRRLGIERQEVVPLVYPTGEAFFAALFGVLLAGAVPAPLYPPLRLGRLEEYHARTSRMVRAVQARVVLADGRVRRMLGRTIELAGVQLGCRTIDELAEEPPDEVGVSADDLALVQFSSGTTLEPKPVALTHRALVTQAEILNGLWPDTEEVRHAGVSWLPLYHDMGLIGCVLPALERPGPLTLIPPELFVARPGIWLRTLHRTGATISPAPSFAYGLCVDKVSDEELDGVDLSRWRIALNGAEAVAPSVLRAFQQRFARWGLNAEALTPVYGLAEAALAVTFSSLDRPFTSCRFATDALALSGRAIIDPDGRELVSVGRPLPGFRVRIVDDDGTRLEEDRIGRVQVAGPSLMSGYLDRPEATASVLRDGWLDTGDLGFVHDGELYLTGRASQLLIVRGRNYSPEEVEHALDELAGVRRGCTVAASYLPDGADAEALVLLVETRDRDDPERLASRCAERTRAVVGVDPAEVVLLEPGTIPRTSSGKLRRPEALRQHLDGTLAPPETVTVVRLARALARSAVAFGRAHWKRRE